MSDTMIWIFGICAFLLLFFLASIWFMVSGPLKIPVPQQGGVGRKDIAALTSGLDEIKTRLTSIEEILRSVE